MSIIKNKKGIGIPTVLGIVTFVIATVATLLTVAVNQSKLIDRSIESTEAYANSVQAVDATLKIIARDQNLDPAYLDALELYMGVSIEPYGANLYIISSMVTTSKSVTSYLTGSATQNSLYDELFSFTGTEPDFILSPLITPEALLGSYLPTYMETNFPWITPQTEFTTLNSIATYIKNLALNHNGFEYKDDSDLETQYDPTAWWHWYVNGSVTIPKNKNLTVPDNRLLVIQGNLVMNDNSIITGNVFVNGSLTINGKVNTVQSIRGTLYVDGNVTTSRPLSLGTEDRPTFIFATGNISFSSSVTGVGYFLCQDFTATKSSADITGGVYAADVAKLPPDGIIAQENLDETEFYTYGIPEILSIEGGNPEVIEFIYTFPKLN